MLAILTDQVLEGVVGIQERAISYGYRTEEFLLRDYPDPHRLAHVLRNRGIRGLLVGQVFQPGFSAAFDWGRFAAVAVCEGYERPPINLIMPNHFKAVQDAWDRAVKLGYRRIGLALFDMPSAIDFHDRCAAFIERQRRVDKSNSVPILAFTPNDANGTGGYARNVRQMDAWVRRHAPDVVLGFNSYFLALLNDTGRHPPERVAFLNLWIMDSNPDATGFRLDQDDVGCRGVEWLDALLRAGQVGLPEHPATMSINLSWQEGTAGTVPPKASTSHPPGCPCKRLRR